MKRRALMSAACVGVLSSVIVSSPAEAAVVTYTYVGQPLHATETGGGWDDTIDGYSGQMVVDEKELGHSLKNATVTFWLPWLFDPSIFLDPDPLPHQPGLVLFDIFPFMEPHWCCDGSITFTTNESREIVDWYGWFMAGPPDGGISTIHDWYDDASGGGVGGPPYVFTGAPGTGQANYFSEGPGTWTVEVTPIPIPGALALFLTALAGLGLVGRAGISAPPVSRSCRHRLPLWLLRIESPGCAACG